jgi:hypothetical protein
MDEVVGETSMVVVLGGLTPGVCVCVATWCATQVVSEDGKKVRRVHSLPDVDLEEMQVFLRSWLDFVGVSMKSSSYSDGVYGTHGDDMGWIVLFWFCLCGAPLAGPDFRDNWFLLQRGDARRGRGVCIGEVSDLLWVSFWPCVC